MNHSLCINCHLRIDICLCQYAPSLQVPVRITILMHPGEWQKVTNTARLLKHCGVAEIVFWQRPMADKIELLLPGVSHCSPVALLFPLDCASTGAGISSPEAWLHSAVDPATNSPVNGQVPELIVLDGTWQQVRKMYRQSPALQTLPVFDVTPSGVSQYALRKRQTAGHLSTVEAVMEVLNALGSTAAAQELQDYFQRFLRHYEANRSGHQQIQRG